MNACKNMMEFSEFIADGIPQLVITVFQDQRLTRIFHATHTKGVPC